MPYVLQDLSNLLPHFRPGIWCVMDIQVVITLQAKCFHSQIVSFLQGHPSLHLTHVTFSPDGHEVLLSYSGEHAYLMNVNQGKVYRFEP